jgi:dynein heavy chain 1
MDGNFRKQLESALRFGTTLFIHDAENFDPLINPVLNRDLRRTAGRVLITIGDKDIDFSPTFRMFLFTRDSDVRLKIFHFSFLICFLLRRNLDQIYVHV